MPPALRLTPGDGSIDGPGPWHGGQAGRVQTAQPDGKGMPMRQPRGCREMSDAAEAGGRRSPRAARGETTAGKHRSSTASNPTRPAKARAAAAARKAGCRPRRPSDRVNNTRAQRQRRPVEQKRQALDERDLHPQIAGPETAEVKQPSRQARVRRLDARAGRRRQQRRAARSRINASKASSTRYPLPPKGSQIWVPRAAITSRRLAPAKVSGRSTAGCRWAGRPDKELVR